MPLDLEPVTIEGAAPAAPAPRPPIPEGEVAVRDFDGSVHLVPAQALPVARAEGSRLATEPEYFGEAAGAGGRVMSAVTGAARGLSFGLSDKATIEADRLLEGDQGADEMRHTLNMLREANPNASLGGEIAGSLAGMFMLPGGAVANEVRGGSALARAGARFAQAAPRAFGEGAAFEMGHQFSEDALGDHDAVGENYVAAGLKGGLFNLLIGGGLHAGGGAVKDAIESTSTALSKVSASNIQAIAQRQFGTAAPGLGERVRLALVKGSAGLSGTQEEVLERLTRLTPEGRAARATAVFDNEKELQAATSAFRGAGDDMLRSNKLTMGEFKGSLKAEKIAKSVATGNEGDVAFYAKSQIDRAIDIAESELNHASGVAPQAVKSLESIARTAYEARTTLEAAISGGVDINAKSFMALDSIKRDVQAWVNGGYNSVGRIADPFEARLAQRSVQTLDGFQKDLIHGLEDSSLWGKAADIQRAVNADWTIQIDASKRFDQSLTTEIGRDPSNPFLRVKGIDPSKADTYARGLLNPNSDLTHKAVRDYVDSTERLAKTLRDNVDLPPGQLAEIDRTINAAKKFRGAVDKAEHVMTLTNQFKQLTERSGDGFATLAGLLGVSTGGPLGGVAGATLGTLANPGRAVAQMAALERMGVKLDEKLKGGLSNFLAGKKAPALAQTSTVTNAQIRALRNGSMARQALQARAAGAVAEMGDVAPKVALAASTTIMRAASYVAMSAPKDPAPAGAAPFVSQEPRPFKASERAKAQASIEVLQDPTVVIDALNEGRLSREHIEALKFIYPKIYLRTQLMVRELAREGTPNLTVQNEVGLSVLFDTPVNAMMRPENIRGFTQSFAQGAEPSQDGAAGGQTAPKRPLGKSRGTWATESDRQEAPT